VVTPAMLMVFTRSENSKVYAFLRKLFRRNDPAAETAPVTAAKPAIVYPKAAE